MALKHAIPIIALVCILSLASWINLSKPEIPTGRQCPLTGGKCTLMFEEQAYSVSFAQGIIALEEELNVTFRIPDGKALSASWIEGVNMFMGKIPVILNEPDVPGIYHGITFLGSCSEPNMRWRMVVEISTPSGRRERLYFNFTTQV